MFDATADVRLIMGIADKNLDVTCSLCRSSKGGIVLLYDPALSCDDNNGQSINYGICRACTVRAVKVWANSPEGFTAVVAPKDETKKDYSVASLVGKGVELHVSGRLSYSGRVTGVDGDFVELLSHALPGIEGCYRIRISVIESYHVLKEDSAKP